MKKKCDLCHHWVHDGGDGPNKCSGATPLARNTITGKVEVVWIMTMAWHYCPKFEPGQSLLFHTENDGDDQQWHDVV